MANFSKRLPRNVRGDFFVDSTCIDCDTCRQLAPRIFGEADDHSFVQHQPKSDDEKRQATRALLACPTGSIGTTGANDSQAVLGDFPLTIEDEVSYCGFTSADSFGGSSYLVRHPEGNWLVDSPRFVAPLVRRIEDLGGIDAIFLTHQDDVADADKWAKHFSARRIIHRGDLDSSPDSEMVLEGNEPVRLGNGDFLAIPTPGHTAGHLALLYRQRFLFSGDHVWWSRKRRFLTASKSVCWDSWSEQTRSMERLADHRFEWILPGHGERVRFPETEMRQRLVDLVERMKKP